MRIRQLLLEKLYILPCILLSGVIMYLSLENREIVKEIAQKSTFTNPSYFSDHLEKKINDNFDQKETFLNLNGAINRIIGINSLNMIEKLAEGSLTNKYVPIDSSTPVNEISRLSAICQENGSSLAARGSIYYSKRNHEKILISRYDLRRGQFGFM